MKTPCCLLSHAAPALLLAGLGLSVFNAHAEDPQAAEWRREHRLIDLHQHVNCTPEHLARAIRIMDETGIGIGVILTPGTVTRKGEEPSAFEKSKELADRLYPGRFLFYANLDYGGWDEPGWSEKAVAQIEEAHRLGAAGLKEWKRLGLYLRNKEGELIRIDDPKLDPVWRRCGELNMPVSIHVADPKAFWLPYDQQNERWTELKDHKSWWFGDPKQFPPREALLAARNRVIMRHPETTFVCVHFGNNPEDIETVGKWLDQYSNMRVDLAARVPEIGRHDPQKVHDLFVKHQDRIIFATDFMVYDRMTLGSGGSGPAPTDSDAVSFFGKHWRWMETWDKNFEHMTPIQGEWTISGIGLPPEVLRKIYFDNARKLLGRSLPAPVLRAARTRESMTLDGRLTESAWDLAVPTSMDYQSATATPLPALSTSVRAVWSDRDLYLGYRCPFTKLTVFDASEAKGERLGLWDRDVVETFIGTDPEQWASYDEFEAAPNGEKLDVRLRPGGKDFEWQSGFETAVSVDEAGGVWTCEMRIPLAVLGGTPARAGTEWRLNLYRCDRDNGAFLAWNPTLKGTFHAPARFGRLVFLE